CVQASDPSSDFVRNSCPRTDMRQRIICDGQCGDHPPKGVHSALEEEQMTAIDISTKYPPVRNYIDGQFVEGNGNTWLDVTNPADGSALSRVPLSPSAAADPARQAAKRAFPPWASLRI